MDVDRLILADWIVPMDDDRTVLEQHCLAIADGRIAAIAPRAAAGQFRATRVIDLAGHVLIPGLINAHTHASMSLFRGLADDMPLMEWLEAHIWPAEARWVREDFVRDGTRLAVAEMIRGGTTCFNDMYFFPDITATACLEAGMRASVGLIVIDFPSAWAPDTDGYFARAIEVYDAVRHEPLVTTAFAPHAPYSVSDRPLQRVLTLSSELDIPVHMHVHETDDEVRGSLAGHGMRPIDRLHRLGLVNSSLLAVHMTQLGDPEIALFAEAGAHVVHCPESNLKLASGFCPVTRLLDAGVNIALGTDGAASNNDLDMFSEMRTAALLAKGVSGNAASLPARQALAMATINGARALGIDDQTGSLTVGKSADITAVDLRALHSQPVYNPVSQVVYSAGREQVSNVWIAGDRVYKDYRLLTMDEAGIAATATSWRTRIAAADRDTDNAS